MQQKIHGHHRQFRDPLKQQLRILYNDDVTNIGAPIEILCDLEPLYDYGGEECYPIEDVIEAWRKWSRNQEGEELPTKDEHKDLLGGAA